MKRILSLFLAAILCLSVFSGCGSPPDDEDKGAIIRTYFTYPPHDLDPGKVYFDSTVLPLFGLLFEGLTRIDEKGKLEKVLAKEWEYEVDKRDGQLKLLITLNRSYWSDGVPVDADDFVFAWKRLLKPETINPAGALLFPIKNAGKVKCGELTIDDLGIMAVGDYELEIVFEKSFTDVEYFLASTASPALYPLREDMVSKGDDWAQHPSTLVTNGPFSVKGWTSREIELSRSLYYKGLHNNANAKETKYVTPHKIILDYAAKPDLQKEMFENDELFYIGAFTKELYDDFSKKIKKQKELSTYTYYFNTEHPLFGDERVRNALSAALDRNEIASIVGRGAVAATGFVPIGIKDTKQSKDFRKIGGDLISPSAHLETAKDLLKQAGVKKGEFTIKYIKRDGVDTWERDVAEYAAGVWSGLGFTVKIQPVKSKLFDSSLLTGDFDVIGLDYQALTADAFSFVVPFGTKTSGSAISVETEEVEHTPHLTGFSDKEYDRIVKSILAAKDIKTRTALFHEAEEYLLEKAPVVPLYYNAGAYLASSKLGGIKTDLFGQKNFTKVSQKNYRKYLPAEEEDAGQTAE